MGLQLCFVFLSSCGKLFKTSEEVEFHAVKSGHTNFSESTEEKKPLTEEEKQQKVCRIICSSLCLFSKYEKYCSMNFSFVYIFAQLFCKFLRNLCDYTCMVIF